MRIFLHYVDDKYSLPALHAKIVGVREEMAELRKDLHEICKQRNIIRHTVKDKHLVSEPPECVLQMESERQRRPWSSRREEHDTVAGDLGPRRNIHHLHQRPGDDGPVVDLTGLQVEHADRQG